VRVYNLTTSQFALSNIALRRLKVARFNDLNDPFELLAVDVAEFDLRVGIRAKKEQIDSTEGLLCFSRTWRSPLLWSHYADKHRGIALGFDVSDPLLVPVQYIQGLHKIKALAKETEQSTIDKLLDRLRYTKFDGWAYEDEVRQFLKLDSLSHQSGLHFVPFSADLVLREVILGPRCDIPVEAVRTLVQAFHGRVHVTRARIAYTKFGVVEDRRFRGAKA
jgi:hypothetical protein